MWRMSTVCSINGGITQRVFNGESVLLACCVNVAANRMTLINIGRNVTRVAAIFVIS